MPTANHVLLQRITTTTSVASITFNSIPQTGYTDLKFVVSARGDVAGTWDDVTIKFNSSTTGYTQRYVYGTGSATASNTGGYSAGYAGHATGTGNTVNTFGNFELYIPNYTGSTAKSFSFDSVTENNATSALTMLGASLWSGTAAITTAEFNLPGGNFLAGSSFSLYGIANATAIPAAAPKADGGDIIKTDGTYWYHAFTGSGIFKPQLNLTADCLVVAGGGGSGTRFGGGGGAGGLVYSASTPLSASNYLVTVGAGGAGGTSPSTGNKGTNGQNSSIGSAVVATGGGGGGSTDGVGNGGSGGGGSAFMGSTGVFAGGTGTSGQGYNGGSGSNNGQPSSPIPAGYYSGGGGGGATAVGTNGDSSNNGGTGGAGSSAYSSWLSITGGGVSGVLARGGNGANYYEAAPSTAGAALSGNGASGAGGGSNNGAAGGSGIVIIRYPV